MLRGAAYGIALVFEALAVLAIAWGAATAAHRVFVPTFRGRASKASSRAAWVGLGRWLLLAVEFMLAADLLRTMVSPHWERIGRLAAIALICTFLSVFLERNLETVVRVAASLPTGKEVP